MSRKGKRRSRPVPDAGAARIVAELERAFARAEPAVPLGGLEPRALAARDSAVRTLRFLKFWLGLPSEAFLASAALLDRFVARVNVADRYLPCVALSCLSVASGRLGRPLDGSRLVEVSQTRCSANDVERMSAIVRSKIGAAPAVTAGGYLNLFLRVFECAATKLDVRPLAARMLPRKRLLTRLEVVMSDHACAARGYPMVALALVQYEIRKFLAEEVPSESPYYSIEMLRLLAVVFELQDVCMVNATDLDTCYNNVKEVLQKYDGYSKAEMKQKMRWKFSARTLFSARPLDVFRTNLSRISEGA